MPKAPLIPEQALLESQIIETLLAGHKLWRPDLSYPESHSDMQAAVRGLMVMFDVRRRSLPQSLKIVCEVCGGIKYLPDPKNLTHTTACPKCNGKGYHPQTLEGS